MNFESLQIGERLHEIDKGVITPAHIMRWSAAVENFHRIHYDAPFATQHDGLPGILINGSWKQHVLVQLVKALYQLVHLQKLQDNKMNLDYSLHNK